MILFLKIDLLCVKIVKVKPSTYCLYDMHIQMLHTFDLLLIPEPAQVGGGLAAMSHAGQSDVVALHGGLRQAIDLRLLRHT